MRWRFILVNFIKRRLQHRYFPMNIAKYLKILRDNRITVDVFRYKIDIFHISCVIALFSFVTLVLE